MHIGLLLRFVCLIAETKTSAQNVFLLLLLFAYYVTALSYERGDVCSCWNMNYRTNTIICGQRITSKQHLQE